MNDPLQFIRTIGTPEQLRAASRVAQPSQHAPDCNAHLHLPPNFSAFVSAAEAMALADAQDCRIVGASNYYDFTVYTDFAREARSHNVFPLFGCEIICMIEPLRAAGIKINDPGNPGKMYICGKGMTRFASMTPEAQRILNTIRQADAKRTGDLVDRVAQVLRDRGLPNDIDAHHVIDMVVRRHGVPRDSVYLQERHVAQAFQEFIFARVRGDERAALLPRLLGAAPKIKSPDDAVGVQNELRAHLMKAGKVAYVNETFIDFEPALALIRELGGFPSYPLLADAATPICPFEQSPQKLAADLKARGIFAAEFIANRNDVALMQRYATVLRGEGLIVTSGTEHNLLEIIPLQPVCLGNVPIPPDLRDIFYEGACVIAAHQFIGAHGESGYTGGSSQISELAPLGRAVIAKYLA